MHAAPTICLQPCPEGTRIHQKPTASSEGAQLWDKHHFTLSWFRKAGPTIILNTIRDASVPLRGTIFRWRCSTYPQLHCFAACSGFHYIGPAPRNPYKTATIADTKQLFRSLTSVVVSIHLVRCKHSLRSV